jgi:hypothetical protein
MHGRSRGIGAVYQSELDVDMEDVSVWSFCVMRSLQLAHRNRPTINRDFVAVCVADCAPDDDTAYDRSVFQSGKLPQDAYLII